MKQALKQKLKSAQRMNQDLKSKGFLRVFEGMGRVVGGIFVSLLFAAFILVTIMDVAPSNSTLMDQLMTSAEDTLSKVGQLVILGVVMLLAKIYRDRQA